MRTREHKMVDALMVSVMLVVFIILSMVVDTHCQTLIKKADCSKFKSVAENEGELHGVHIEAPLSIPKECAYRMGPRACWTDVWVNSWHLPDKPCSVPELPFTIVLPPTNPKAGEWMKCVKKFTSYYECTWMKP